MKTYNLNEIQELGYTVENNMIKCLDVDVIAHFGNVVCFDIMCDMIRPYSVHNNTKNIGYMIKEFIVFFGLEEEDGIRLHEIKNIPCRLVMQDGRAVGMGHYMQDRFFLFEDFSIVGFENG